MDQVIFYCFQLLRRTVASSVSCHVRGEWGKRPRWGKMPMPFISLLIYKNSLLVSAAGSSRGVVCFGTGKMFELCSLCLFMY